MQDTEVHLERFHIQFLLFILLRIGLYPGAWIETFSYMYKYLRFHNMCHIQEHTLIAASGAHYQGTGATRIKKCGEQIWHQTHCWYWKWGAFKSKHILGNREVPSRHVIVLSIRFVSKVCRLENVETGWHTWLVHWQFLTGNLDSQSITEE